MYRMIRLVKGPEWVAILLLVGGAGFLLWLLLRDAAAVFQKEEIVLIRLKSDFYRGGARSSGGL